MNQHLSGIKGIVNAETNEIVERRKHVRFKVRDGVFTVPKPRVQSSRLGNVIDVSMGGLAFQYFLIKNMSVNDFTELDVYISGDGLFLENLPINLVSDIEMKHGETQFMTISKRFGVQFKGLDQAQKEKLHHFIDHHTLCKE